MSKDRQSLSVRAMVVILGVAASVALPVGSASAAVAEGACSSRTSGDFDADGAADLAVGVPGQDVDGSDGAGAVHVFYGDDPAGLDPARDDVLTQGLSVVEDDARAGDGFGSCLVSGDFNGDGQSDLAIGVPGENIGSAIDAGAINVIYGTDDGLDGVGPPGDDFIHQDSFGVQGASESGDVFGSALAAGDFDGDGRDDLAIGAPGDDIVDVADGGAVNVIYGAGDGLTYEGNQLFFQDARNMAEVSERRDVFGASLAAGDLDGSGEDDLAIGVPGESIRSKRRAGAVQVMYAAASGLTAKGDVLWHQNKAGIVADGAQAGDRFGSAVTIGDFDDDGFGDLAVGTPREDVGTVVDAGAVNVLYGSATGVDASTDDFITQDATGETSEPEDLFGASLAAADMSGDGYDDLAIGVPAENDAAADAGIAIVVYGSAAGLDETTADRFSQDTADVEDQQETNDVFASALAAGDYNGDGYDDLAIGVPGEDIGTDVQAGAVNVIYGSATGLDPAGVLPDVFLHEDVSGEGNAESDDFFGAALA